MLSLVPSIAVWFHDVLETVDIDANAKPYVVQTLTKPAIHHINSVVIAKSFARTFKDNQLLGDYALWKSSFVQGYNFQELTETIGRMSYYDCYRMTGRRLFVYEMLADGLPELTKQINMRLNVSLTVWHPFDT